jgi:hypothetical protein
MRASVPKALIEFLPEMPPHLAAPFWLGIKAQQDCNTSMATDHGFSASASD